MISFFLTTIFLILNFPEKYGKIRNNNMMLNVDKLMKVINNLQHYNNYFKFWIILTLYSYQSEHDIILKMVFEEILYFILHAKLMLFIKTFQLD